MGQRILKKSDLVNFDYLINRFLTQRFSFRLWERLHGLIP